MTAVPPPPPEHTAGRGTRWALLGGALLGCGMLIGLVVVGLGIAAYLYVSSPQPSEVAGDSGRKVTPTWAEAEPVDASEADEGDPGSAEETEHLALSQDHDRRERISRKVAEAMQGGSRTQTVPLAPEQPPLDEELPVPSALTAMSVDAALPKSPRLATLFHRPVA